MENNVPSSFSRWDKTAKLGLVSICVILAAVMLFFALSSPPQNGGGTVSGLVPDDAVNVALPNDKLDEVEAMLTPLLRGNVTAFESIDSANTGEIVAALLSHICEANGIEADETGAKTVSVSEVDALYSALFSVDSPKGHIQNGKVAKYDSENSVWLFYGSEYFPEYKVNIVSTYTLGDRVYVQVEAVKPAEVPSELPSEAPSEAPSEIPSEPEEEVTSEGTESEETVSDTVTSLPDEDVSSDIVSEDVSSEESVAPEIEYVTVRSVVVTLTATDGQYTVTEMREV